MLLNVRSNAKMRPHITFVRQAKSCSIDTEEIKAIPAFVPKMLVKILGQMIIEINEEPVFQLGPGLG